jgi:ABC-2 type transport system ATP-binding protein
VQQVCDRVGLFVKGKLVAEGDIPALSRNLHGKEPYTIEAVISSTINNSLARLQDELLRVEGVKHVSFMNGLLRLSCTKDATADIARAIVASGSDLYQLTKKEYGLDEIYNHYFRETDRA